MPTTAPSRHPSPGLRRLLPLLAAMAATLAPLRRPPPLAHRSGRRDHHLRACDRGRRRASDLHLRRRRHRRHVVRRADVLVVGSVCQTPAAVVNRGADVSAATLDPGDTWTYQCQVQTTPGATELAMTGRVAATDGSGAAVSANTPSRRRSQAARSAVAGLHRRSGSARVVASSSCSRGSAVVSGSRIDHATFFVDGKLAGRVLRPDGTGRFTLHLRHVGPRPRGARARRLRRRQPHAVAHAARPLPGCSRG